MAAAAAVEVAVLCGQARASTTGLKMDGVARWGRGLHPSRIVRCQPVPFRKLREGSQSRCDPKSALPRTRSAPPPFDRAAIAYRLRPAGRRLKAVHIFNI